MTLTLQDGFIIYTVGALLIAGALGVYDRWRARMHAWNVSEEQLGECAECGLTFLVRRNDMIVRCPRCQRLCTNRRH